MWYPDGARASISTLTQYAKIVKIMPGDTLALSLLAR